MLERIALGSALGVTLVVFSVLMAQADSIGEFMGYATLVVLTLCAVYALAADTEAHYDR